MSIWPLRFEALKQEAMKNELYKTPDMIHCTCGNHMLLMPGHICEVCMGVAPETDEALPPGTTDNYDQFDIDYFEALERMFEHLGFAA